MAPKGRSKSKNKKLRWAHVTNTEVQSALSGLLENTIVVLPETCVQSAGLEPNISDKNKPKKLWLGRLKYLPYLLTARMLEELDHPEEIRRTVLQSAVHTVQTCRAEGDNETTSESVAAAMYLARMSDEELGTIARAAIKIQSAWRGARLRRGQHLLDVLDDYFGECVLKGCVLFLCGSTGIAGDSLRYVRMLAGMGYLVIAPDQMASNSNFFSRKDAAVLLRYEDDTDYWQRNLLYEDEGAEGELVYNSTSRNFISDPEHFDTVYNNVITIRQAGLALLLRKLPPFMRRHGVFLYGMSEGAVVLSSFNDEMYADMMRGRIICSYSCEQNYWNYNRPEDAGIAGSPTIPSLNIIGYSDEYFGYQDSVSTSVASVGEYPPITGNAFDAFVAAGLEWGLVAHLEGGRHGLTWTHDTVIRELLSDFLERPQYTCRQIPHLWGHTKTLQDEITRVRRSVEGKVMYIRVRPPTAEEVVVPQEGRDDSLANILNMLNRRLYQLEHEQPITPLGAGEGEGADTRLLWDFDAELSALVEGEKEKAEGREGGGPRCSTSIEDVKSNISAKLSKITSKALDGKSGKAAATVARTIFHVSEGKPHASAAANGSTTEGHKDSAPPTGGSPSDGNSLIGLSDTAISDAGGEGHQAAQPELCGNGLEGIEGSSPVDPPRRIILNTSLHPPSGLLQPTASSAAMTRRQSFHKMEREAEAGAAVGGGRVNNWVADTLLPSPGRATARYTPAALSDSGMKRRPATSVSALTRALQPATQENSKSHVDTEDLSLSSTSSDGRLRDDGMSALKALADIVNKQVEASGKAHDAIEKLSAAMSTVAVATAVSSAVTAVALLAALGCGLMRGGMRE